MEIPILKIDNCLVVSIQGSLTDTAALDLQEHLARDISQQEPVGVLVDLTAVEIVDSFVAKVLGDISSMSKLMGVNVVVTGIQPGVAITLIELGITLDSIRTALNLQKGIDLLRASYK